MSRVSLFKAFCTLLYYTAHLWSNYKASSMQKLIVQAFYAKMGVNLPLIATKPNSADFASLICPEKKKVARNSMKGKFRKWPK